MKGDRGLGSWRAVVVALSVVALGCGAGERDAAPRGVVLMIGDGLGFPQVALARNLVLGKEGRFRFETLPITAIVSCYSDSNPTTDSGAAATALSSGVKTGNLFVGTDPAGRPVKTLTEVAKERGWKVGYVTTTTVTHATPAGFYAHVPNRYTKEDDIADHLLRHAPDLVLGGGLASFRPAEEGGQRLDDRDLVAEAEAAGFTVWKRGADLDAPVPERLLGLFAHGHLGYQLDERRLPEERRDPSLAALTRLALRRFEGGGEPFFLLVEGGRIDHAGHSFDPAGVAAETEAFDAAVAAVLEYRERHPDTLVLVTADHSTGGLALNDYVDWEALERQTASVDWLADQIRNAGAGPELVAEHTGYDDLTDEDVEEIRGMVISYDARRKLGSLLSQWHGVTFMPKVSLDTFGHTGEDIPLYAGGPGAERFQGVLDNTEIPVRIAQLLGWPDFD